MTRKLPIGAITDKRGDIDCWVVNERGKLWHLEAFPAFAIVCHQRHNFYTFFRNYWLAYRYSLQIKKELQK